MVTETLQIRNDDIMDTVYSSQTIEQPELLGMCRFEAKRKLIKARNGGHSKAAMNGIVDQFYECFRRVLAPILREKKNEMKFEERVLKTVSTQLENFTCTGDLEESSPDVDTRDWIDEKDNIQRRVHVKLDRPATQIHVVEDFASVEECKAMEEDVANRLGVATTEDGKGGARISNNRKVGLCYWLPVHNPKEAIFFVHQCQIT